MHVFTRILFTTDLVANDCRVFDWVAAVNKKNDDDDDVLFVAFVCVRAYSSRPSRWWYQLAVEK